MENTQFVGEYLYYTFAYFLVRILFHSLEFISFYSFYIRRDKLMYSGEQIVGDLRL